MSLDEGGIPEAVRRLQRSAAEVCPSLEEMPDWVVGCDADGFFPLANAHAFAHANEYESCMRGRIYTIVAARNALRVKRGESEECGNDDECYRQWQVPHAEETGQCVWSLIPLLVVATRVEYGAFLEEVSCHVAMLAAERSDSAVCVRCCADSSLVSCWTSSHAEHLSSLLLLWSHATPLADDTPIDYAMLPEPHPVPWCVDGLPDCAHLVDAHGPNGSNDIDGRVSGTMKLFKSQLSVMSRSGRLLSTALNRCTDAGLRGWSNDIVRHLVKDSSATGWVMKRALTAALTGMNPMVHPCLRLSWHKRAHLARVVRDTPPADLLSSSHVATRCATRLYLARLMLNQEAEASALRTIGHPVGLLSMPPLASSVKPFQDALASLCRAGRCILQGAQGSTCSDHHVRVVVETLKTSFAASKTTVEPVNPSRRSRKSKAIANRAMDSANAHVTASTMPSADVVDSAQSFLNANWIQRSRPVRKRSSSLVSTMNSLALQDYTVTFGKVWRSFARRGSRLSRIDHRQHHFFAERNCVNQWQMEVDDSVRLRVIRAALGCTLADIMTMQQVAVLLGLTTSANANTSLSSVCLMKNLDTHSKGQLCLFARIASIKRQLLTFALDGKTTQLQRDAVRRRYRRPPDAEMETLPLHAEHAMACTYCKHVCNTTVTDSVQGSRFMDIGFRGVMSDSSSDRSCPVFRCAKRTSATDKCTVCVEQNTRNIIQSGMKQIRGVLSVDKNICQRDTRATFTTPLDIATCGVDPVLTIKLTGRLVFAFGSAFTQCSVCGGVTALTANNRHGAAPCCMKCDWTTCYADAERPSERAARAVAEVVCAFCGKPDTNKRARHAIYSAPLDDSEHNKNIPKPLRRLAFCSAHDKQWLGCALRHLNTNVVIAHLTMRARPEYGFMNDNNDDMRLVPPNDAGRKRKRKLPTKRHAPLLLK